jgi:uncharacterized protein (TIGR02270 family)
MELGNSQLIVPTPKDLILWDVIEEHFREAEFVFQQWRTALFSPLYTLDQIEAKVERRLRGHLDGLAIGGPIVADRLLYPELEETIDADRATVSALVLLTTGNRDQWRDVLDALVYADDEDHRQGLALAIEMYDDPYFKTVLKNAFEAARTPREKAYLLEILAARRLDLGEHLERCFDMGFPPLTAAAIRIAGRVGRHKLAPMIERYLEDNQSTLRAAAMEAGLFLDLASAWTRCREQAAGTGRRAARALLLVALLGSPRDHRVLRGQLENETMREAALWALGFTGHIESAEICLPYLESEAPRVAKLAAESVCSIIGLDLANDDLIRVKSEQEEAANDGSDEDEDDLLPLELDDLDADLVPDAVGSLPLPRVEAIKETFRANRDTFATGERYLFGEPFTPAALVRALGAAPMRRRHALALELAYRTGAKRYLTTEAFTGRQRKQLAELSDLKDQDFINRFGGS